MASSEPPIKTPLSEAGVDGAGGVAPLGGADEIAAPRKKKKPKKQIAFTPKDPVHACVEFRKTKSGFIVIAVCRSETFRGLRRIEAVNALGRTELRFEKLKELKDNRVRYKVRIPRDAVEHERTTFRAVMKSGRTSTVWTAGAADLRLPPNWRFNIYHLYLQFDPQQPSPHIDTVKCYLRKLKQEPHRFVIDLTLFCARPEDLEGAALSVIRFRDEANFTDIPLEPMRAKKPYRIPEKFHRKFTGMQSFYCTAAIPLEDGALEPWLYSLTLRLKDGRTRGVFYYYPKVQANSKKTFLWEHAGKLRIVHLFPDRSTANLRMEYFALPAEHAAEAKALISPATKITDEPAWLIGENINTARDNGWRMFEYLRANRPDIDARYVITERNSDNIATDGKTILRYGSIEHLRAARAAEAVLFAHHSIYVAPRLISDVRRRAKRKTVEYFLQHGVLALKPMLHLYKRNKQTTYTLFNVSSEWERQLVARETGWDPDDITVAGLPRWDALTASQHKFQETGGKIDSILVFPTWRNGLEKQAQEAFMASAYYTNWLAALSALAQKCRAASIRLDFCPHGNFQRFNSLFEVEGVHNIDVLEAVRRLPGYAMLVTDYSSLTFDFLYLRKPTTFFTFDSEEYFATEKPYIGFAEFPGRLASTPEQLVANVFDDAGHLRTTDPAEIEQHHARYIIGDENGGNCERVIAETFARLAMQKAPTAAEDAPQPVEPAIVEPEDTSGNGGQIDPD